MIETRLAAVRLELPTNEPVMLLEEIDGAGRTLPIVIGAPEATAIAYAHQQVPTARPMTHDLMRDICAACELVIERVVITELHLSEEGRGAIYYSDVHVRRDDDLHKVSSRPSDAVALALRTGSPIYVDDSVMEEAGLVLGDEGQDGHPEEPEPGPSPGQ